MFHSSLPAQIMHLKVMITGPEHNPRDNPLISNLLSLSVLQAVNCLLPVVVLPYLVRILGAERFGLVAFAYALMQYFVILTDYGFNLAATRDISIHRTDRTKLSEIFTSVMLIKLALMAASFVFLLVLVLAVSRLRTDKELFFLAFGLVVAQVLFPTWFFQGLEKMRHIATLNILAKLFFAITIFSLVKSRTDYIYVPLFNALGLIVAALIGLGIVMRQFSVRIRFPPLSALKEQLQNAWPIFLSRLAINIYTASNTVILGLFASNAVVGYYAAAEKIVRGIQNLQAPLSQAMYPHVSRLARQSKQAALHFIARIARIVTAITFIISVALLALAPQLSRLLLGPQFAQSVTVIRILAFLPFVVGLSNIFGVQTMLNFGLQRTFSVILTVAGILDIGLALLLVRPLHHLGIAISVLVTEIFVTVLMFVFLQRNDLKIFQFRPKLAWQ